MQSKNKLFFLVILAMSILILGVNGCGTQTPTTSTITGLEMSFVKDAPPVSVVAGQEFPIYVEVINKGGEIVNKGSAKFYLSGLGQNFENVKSSAVNDKTLLKESIFPEKLVFAEKAKFTFPIQDFAVFPFVLTSCYDYSSRAQGTLCISASNESTVCKFSGEKVTSNTAGPVQLTSITESIVKNKLIVSFDITNKGKGQVYLQDVNCDKLETRDFAESQKQGKLNIKITTRDDFICRLQTSTGQTEGLEGIVPIGKVLCEKDISKSDYSSIITVEMRYKYRDSISQSINVNTA